VEVPREPRAPRAWRTFVSVALLVTYLVVPTVTTTVFRTFVCEPFDAEVGGELRTDRLLVADVTVDCGSASYAAHRIFALLMVAVWPVGVPLWYFVLLRDARARIDPEVDGAKARMKADGGEALVGLALEIRDGDASIQHLSLLYGPYEGEFWYWEIVELLRRVAATSVVMVVSDGDVSRLFYCIILSILSLNLYDLFEPFISASDDLLAEALQLITLLNFIATLGFAVGAGGFLGALMLALQLVAVVASAALIWTDVFRERAALEFLAEEAKQQMKEYGVDLTGRADAPRKKRATKRESVSEVAEAVGAAFAGLFGDAPDEHSAADDDDNRSWDSAEDRDDFSEGSAGDIDALCTPMPLSVRISDNEEL
jgi:hypothetical protein